MACDCFDGTPEKPDINWSFCPWCGGKLPTLAHCPTCGAAFMKLGKRKYCNEHCADKTYMRHFRERERLRA